jgi:hypothetical protein
MAKLKNQWLELEKLMLGLVSVLTILLSANLRIRNMGWEILVWGIPLLATLIVHAIVQVKSIRSVAFQKPGYAILLLLSNLLLFLGFAAQPAIGDSGYSVPIMFQNLVSQAQAQALMSISCVSFMALAFSWALLLKLGTPTRLKE